LILLIHTQIDFFYYAFREKTIRQLR